MEILAKLLLTGVLAMVITLAISLLVTLISCGESSEGGRNNKTNEKEKFDDNAKADENYYIWDGNTIVGLTDEGKKQENLLIPKRCEGFGGPVLSEAKVKHAAFEDDDDIKLGTGFLGGEYLMSVDLPDNLTEIPESAFFMCEKLQSIEIPASVSVIGKKAFSGCESLQKVEFKGIGIQEIPPKCFENCDALTDISLPQNIEIIREYAFFKCGELKNVTLPETVTTFEKLAFGNTALTEIHFLEAMHISSMDMSAFGMEAYSMAVYIVEGSDCDQTKDEWDIGFSEIKYEP